MKKFLYRFQSLKYRKKLLLTYLLISILPLSIMGVFCYHQTIRLLLNQESDSLDSALNTAVKTIDSQITLYEDLLTYLAGSEEIVDTPSREYQGIYDTYEHLTYGLDVFLKAIYTQHPEILQITLYNAESTLSHGNQLRPLSDLETQSWYSAKAVTPHPSWHMNSDGTLCLIQRIPDPFVKYIESYSKNCICIRLSPKTFFQTLDNISNDYQIRISSPTQKLYSYTSPSVKGLAQDPTLWTSLSSTTEKQGWTILLEKPTHAVSAPADQMALIIIAIILACLLLIFTTSRILSSVFVRRINTLHDHMKLVTEGDLDVTIHDSCPDEIGELTENFQKMLDEINRLIREDYKNKIQIKEEQLKALQAQINPHFLYNCLSLINSKALINKQPEISQMSQLLSVFYRTTLNKGKSETTLQNEIRNVQSYIDIQRLLHDNSFDVTYQIDPSLPEISVPNLLLQPLVENSIIHGILPNKNKRGKLFLMISRVNRQIHFSILDNGVGIPKEALDTLLRKDSGGYGLRNVNERIRLAYGEKYGLKINSIPNESTMITFYLPIP